MNEQEFINLLQKHKDAPELGGGFDASHAERFSKRFRAEFGLAPDAAPRAYSWNEYADFAFHRLGLAFARPMAVGASVFAVIFGGWVATVNASFDSVPGDTLYPVKLATERMQLAFSPSGERKARLHAEFAGRRLQEVSEISVSDRPDKTARLKAAVANFTQEVASANEQLAALGEESPALAVDLAVALEQKANEYEALLTQTPTSQSDVDDEVAGAREAVEQVNDTAVETLVSAQEQGGSSQALEKNFQSQVMELRGLIALSTARLSAIKSALSAADQLDEARESDIAQLRQVVTSRDQDITSAMNAFAVGGYRRGFELLDVIETDIRAAQQGILTLELSITAPPPSPSP
ncbi:hypothetical protein A2856_01385 [Candidatus Uhrbacteria bacterium RIFCSPHIGHO2_01_FULL_63_20]|uniref:DUF5667 domain-containing protein n=1 Tax=Candidatus Uhrbacteria bacterium RIFCSPHIGHO2_01_FULL_63_20 TaxID=1802385 RepID=A0A1F7TK53_9BACT|nr:MAG: hypothetical protein A2856_01385 [Candidatus Uhrbacteria bacterium RIFCSPHIGHO2_01_FULL_63_20]